MLIYYAIVHKDVDSAFGISFPDLPGCFSASDREADVHAAAQEALSLYFQDGGEAPAPRSIEDVRKDDEIKADLAAGAYLIGVPVVYSTSKQRYNLMLDRGQVESVDAIARRVGVSRSEFVARAIEMRISGEVGAALLGHSRSTSRAREATSAKVASAAAKVMKDPKASKEAKSAAASALTQKGSTEQTSAAVATKASKVLRDKSASAAEKTVAASALTQKTKAKAAAAAPAKKAPAKKK